MNLTWMFSREGRGRGLKGFGGVSYPPNPTFYFPQIREIWQEKGVHKGLKKN